MGSYSSKILGKDITQIMRSETVEPYVHQPSLFVSKTTDDILGLKPCVKYFETHIGGVIRQPNMYGKLCFPTNNVILLFGPDGCGKRTLIEHYCKQNTIGLYEIEPDMLDTDKSIKETVCSNGINVQEIARPCVFTFYDVEKIENERKLLFLRKFSKYAKESPATSPVWLVVTSGQSPFSINRELVYGFDLTIYVPPPGEKERRVVFERMLAKFEEETGLTIDIDDDQMQTLLYNSRGTTVSEIIEYCRIVFSKWITEQTCNGDLVDFKTVSAPTWVHFENAFVGTMKGPSIVNIDVDKRMEIFKDFVCPGLDATIDEVPDKLGEIYKEAAKKRSSPDSEFSHNPSEHKRQKTCDDSNTTE